MPSQHSYGPTRRKAPNWVDVNILYSTLIIGHVCWREKKGIVIKKTIYYNPKENMYEERMGRGYIRAPSTPLWTNVHKKIQLDVLA